MARFEHILDDSFPLPVEVFLQDSQSDAFDVDEHWHDCFEMLYFMEGRARQTIGRRAFEAGRDDLVLIKSGDVHSTHPLEEDVRILVVKFMPSLLGRAGDCKYLAAFLNDSAHHSVSALGEVERAEIRSALGAVFSEYMQKKPAYDLVLTGCIYQLVGLLLRHGLVVLPDDRLLGPDFPRMNEAIRMVEQSFCCPITLRELAEKLNMNYAYTSRYFKKLTGKTFREYLSYVRVAEADRRLREGRENITEIALETGFASPQAFSRCYRQVKGFPPSVYKEVKKR